MIFAGCDYTSIRSMLPLSTQTHTLLTSAPNTHFKLHNVTLETSPACVAMDFHPVTPHLLLVSHKTLSCFSTLNHVHSLPPYSSNTLALAFVVIQTFHSFKNNARHFHLVLPCVSALTFSSFEVKKNNNISNVCIPVVHLTDISWKLFTSSAVCSALPS